MNTRPKPTIVAAIMIVLTILQTILMAQNKQPNSAGGRDAAGPAVEGKILWQYNTDG